MMKPAGKRPATTAQEEKRRVLPLARGETELSERAPERGSIISWKEIFQVRLDSTHKIWAGVKEESERPRATRWDSRS